jgi:prevent-host-death family protein
MRLKTRKSKWQMQEAKAKLSELVKAADKYPQIITVRGKEKAVLLSMEEYKKLAESKKPSLLEFIRNSPLYGVELELPKRRIEPMREIDL